jgi:putative acetyltransferase
MIYRLLTQSDAVAAANLHRIAGALIPGYDTTLHTEEEYHILYRDRVMIDGPVWGAFEGAVLRGHIALLSGWIDHLYVDPEYNGKGIGSALVSIAQSCLRLYMFQANVRARSFYERHGFIIEKLTNGDRNEEKMPV